MKSNSIKWLLGIFFLCAFQFACKSTDEFEKHIKDKEYYLTWTPPSGVKIAGNLFYDQGEATNINWMEYQYWTGKVYGGNSAEYKSTLQDTLVWIDSIMLKSKIACLTPYIKYYLRHPAYQDYPVIGITQQQAIAFAKWRSDRVMEFILVANNVIKWDSAPNKETCFTIEKYYEGRYKNMKPDPRFSYYPYFRLPTIDEWKRAMKYSDSISVLYPKDSTHSKLWLDINPCKNDTILSGFNPTEKTTDTISPPKNAIVYNLLDNVSEWTSDSGICVGGGWFDKKEIVLKQDTFHRTKPNAWTGFRNVCQWKKWDIKN